jgi:hypothetical protein
MLIVIVSIAAVVVIAAALAVKAMNRPDWECHHCHRWNPSSTQTCRGCAMLSGPYVPMKV